MTLADKDVVRDRSSLGSAMNASLFVGKITNYWIFIGFQDTFLWKFGHFFLENPVKSVNLSPEIGEKRAVRRKIRCTPVTVGAVLYGRRTGPGAGADKSRLRKNKSRLRKK